MLSVRHQYHHHHHQNTAVTDELCIPTPGVWEHALNKGSHMKKASMQSLALLVLFIASFSLHFENEDFPFSVLDTLPTVFLWLRLGW